MTRLGFLGSILGIFGFSKLNAKPTQKTVKNNTDAWITLKSGSGQYFTITLKNDIVTQLKTYNCDSFNEQQFTHTQYCDKKFAILTFLTDVTIYSKLREVISHHGIINEGSLDAPVWKLQAR